MKFLLPLALSFILSYQLVPINETETKEFTKKQFLNAILSNNISTIKESDLDYVSENIPNLVVYNGNSNLSILEEISFTLKNEINVSFVQIPQDEPNTEFISVYFKDRPMRYKGEISNRKELEEWIIDRLKLVIHEIQSLEEMEKFMNKTQTSKLLLYFNSSMEKEVDVYKRASEIGLLHSQGKIVVAITRDPSLIKEPGNITHPCLILYKETPDDQKIAIYKNNLLDIESVVSFIRIYQLPLVSVFDSESSIAIFSADVQAHIFLFIAPEELNEKNEIIREYQAAAMYNRDEELLYERVVFTIVPINEENFNFMSQFDQSKSKLNNQLFVTIFDSKFGGLNKFQFPLNESFSQKNILDFLTKVRMKQYPVFYKSEEIDVAPIQGVLKKVVGINFEEQIIRKRNHFLVLFCSEDFPLSCQEPIDFFVQLDQKLNAGPEQKNPVLLAFYDINRNENSRFLIDEIPEVRFYHKNDKRKPMAFKDNLNEASVVNFIKFMESDFTWPSPSTNSTKSEL